MIMYRNRFKLETSLAIVVSHIAIFFVAVYCQFKSAFGAMSTLDVLSSLIPLFGLFLTVIIKDTISGQYDLSKGRPINLQMVWITRIILISYTSACFLTFLMFSAQLIVTPEELSHWITFIEVGLGLSLGLIVDNLFGGENSPILDNSNNC